MTTLDPRALAKELRQRAEHRAKTGGPFTKENLVEWRAAEYIASLSQPQAGEPAAMGVFRNGEMIGFVGLGEEYKLPEDTDERRPLYASPQPANPVQVTDDLLDKAIVAYNTCNPGRLANRDQMSAALTAAIGADGQAVAFASRQSGILDFDVNGAEIINVLLHPKGTLRPENEIPLYAHPVQQGWQPTHRHVKRGSEYMLIGIGKMQTSNWMDEQWSHEPQSGNPPQRTLDPVDMREVAIYRGEDGKLWVRPQEEFEDGRFEALPAAPQPKGE